MAKGSKGNVIGSWAFLIGVILAIILGAMNNLSNPVLITLVVIGLIVGLLNVTGSEAVPFLTSGAVLIIAAALGQDVMEVIPRLNSVLEALLAIFVPSTIIVAIKNVFSLARN